MTDQTTRKQTQESSDSPVFGREFVWLLAVLLLLLGVLFRQSFNPGFVLHSNDGPLGFIASAASRLPDAFTGFWQHLNWVGKPEASAVPNVSWLILWALSPIHFARFYAPLSLLILGVSSFVYFKQLNLARGVALISALAVTFNMNVFSNVCWGLGSRAMMLAFVFLSLACIQTKAAWPFWLRSLLAGSCIGMVIMEGYDVGALFSMVLGIYWIFHSIWVSDRSDPGRARLHASAIGLVIMVAVAALVSAHALSTLIGTQIQGVATIPESASVDPTVKEQERLTKWNYATQWSLPKSEILRVLIPGLFGFRMDTPGGGSYWGAVGQTPGNPITRFSGAGEYAGVAVVLVSVWALIQAFSRSGVAFGRSQKRSVTFWSVVCLVTVLFAFGRYAPFYQLIYPLPFFSNMRNPIKFMHLFHWALSIPFAYGLHGLIRVYLNKVNDGSAKPLQAIRNWWGGMQGPEKVWGWFLCSISGLGLFSYLLYAASRGELIGFLKKVHPPGLPDSYFLEIADFSIRQVGLFALFLLLTAGLLVLLSSGFFTGKRSRWFLLSLGMLIAVDLGRSNGPWIVYWDVKSKYADNAILDRLKDKPHEQRVTLPMFPLSEQAMQAFEMLGSVYNVEWLQHQFQYYGVQSLDVIQLPRAPESYNQFNRHVKGDVLRYWELTNTRYILNLAGVVPALNQQLGDQGPLFEVVDQFTFSPGANGSVETVLATNGPFALIRYKGALPRARLYYSWTSQPNPEMALPLLTSAGFNPQSHVLVSGDPTLKSSGEAKEGEQPFSDVEITHYSSKNILLKASALQPGILLLNDAYHEDWKVLVDGKPTGLLRCNYLMKGVKLSQGDHEIQFVYEPPSGSLWVTLASMFGSITILGLGLSGCRGFLKPSPPNSRSQSDPKPDEK